MPKISACIVAYCDYDEVCAAVRSILHYTPAPDLALYVVDNGSPDGCGRQLAETDFGDSRVTVLPLEKNIGFGKGHNYVLDRLTSDVHFILNPDILLTGDVLEDMAAWLLARPGAAMATPQLRYPDGKLQHLPRRKPTPWLLLARQLAREQGALYEIERITFTKALETFDSLCRAGSVSGDAMLFVNSIASTCLTQADVDYIDSRWHELRRRMVIEITEEEEIDYEALERKRNAPGFSGMFALDDYGSGYSNENTLLQLAPRFVKVDITIIRGIDTSPDKQQILRNMVAYAHPRSMKIVAEGVETAAELRTVIELGADLLQGYFLARPAIVPGAIAPEAAGIIQELQRRKKD